MKVNPTKKGFTIFVSDDEMLEMSSLLGRLIGNGFCNFYDIMADAVEEKLSDNSGRLPIPSIREMNEQNGNFEKACQTIIDSAKDLLGGRMENFDNMFTVEIKTSKGWEVVSSENPSDCDAEYLVEQMYSEILQEGEYQVRMTSPAPIAERVCS